jgi:hypothetical protein
MSDSREDMKNDPLQQLLQACWNVYCFKQAFMDMQLYGVGVWWVRP